MISRYLAAGALVAGALFAAVPASAAPATSRAVGTLLSVSCASTSHCWAAAQDGAGAAIVATVDGGDAWHVEYTTTRFDDVSDLACTSDTHCLAIADAEEGAEAKFLETTDGGEIWTVHAAPKLAIAEAVSCANGSDCWAVGYAANRVDAAVAHTTDGGAVWAAQPVPKLETAMSNPFGISCASSVDCLVTGDGTLTTANGGRTWTEHAGPEGPLGPVACPSTEDCYGVLDVTSAIPSNEETSVYTSTDGGAAWRVALSGPRRVAGLGGISCPSTSRCVAVGGGYTPERGGKDTLYAVSETTATGGRNWAEVELAGVQYLYADSCVTGTTDCIAVGSLNGTAGVVMKSTDDGATWTREPLPKV